MRHQHGLFARWAPFHSPEGGGEWLTVMAEADAIVAHLDDGADGVTTAGGVGWGEGDIFQFSIPSPRLRRSLPFHEPAAET